MLARNGWRLLRNGGDHDVYTDGVDMEAIPRHNELKENLVKAIIKNAVI